MRSFLKNLIFLFVLTAVYSVSASSFDEISKSFIVFQASSGKTYLAAAVKMNGKPYVLTSQSLFFNPIPKFRLKSFSGKNIKYSTCEAAGEGDFLRIKLEEGSPVTALPLAANAGGNKEVYSMQPDTGIVHAAKAGGGNLARNGFPCVAGAPVINDKGQFVGVASRTDDGLGKRIVMKFAAIKKGEKWLSVKTGVIAKQAYSLEKMRNFTKALGDTRDNNGKNEFIEINENTHSKLMGWAKEQNKQAFDSLLAKKNTGKKAKSSNAMREHQARCFHYASIKRLAAFYNSNAQMAKKGRWSSRYLKGKAKALFNENNSSAKELKGAMKSLVEMYPSIKAKL